MLLDRLYHASVTGCYVCDHGCNFCWGGHPPYTICQYPDQGMQLIIGVQGLSKVLIPLVRDVPIAQI